MLASSNSFFFCRQPLHQYETVVVDKVGVVLELVTDKEVVVKIFDEVELAEVTEVVVDAVVVVVEIYGGSSPDQLIPKQLRA